MKQFLLVIMIAMACWVLAADGARADVSNLPDATAAGGQGKATISIATIEDLQKIGHDPAYPLDGVYALANDIDASGTAGWNDGRGFDPIGSSDSVGFTGIFDGQGHVITGLVIDRRYEDNVGLFGYVEGALIMDFGLEGGSVTGFYNVGGLVGYNDYGTIASCYTTGAVTGYGGSVGGLVGENYGGAITSCYATGAVTGYGSYVGGLAGCNAEGTITASFWNTESSGQSSSAGGTGLTTAQMRTRSTFTDAGWDFDTVWGINEGLSYPYFLWQPGPGEGEGEGEGELVLTAPNGGEAWGCGTTQTITWCNTSGDAGADVRLGLEKGEEFVDWIVRRTENDGAYNWIVWTDLEPADDYAVRVQSFTDNAYRDLSDGPFSIQALGVKVPNGGEAWVMGDVCVIEWGSHDTLVGADVRIGLHYGMEFLYWITRRTENDGRYYWKVPTDLAPGIGYRIRVQSYMDNTLRDLTDTPFTIVLPKLMWTFPGFQDELTWGETYDVTWDCNNMGAVGPNVRIGLHKGGAFIDWIRRTTPNDGAFSWTVGQRLGALEPAASYRLRLQSYTNKDLRCMSPAFVINAAGGPPEMVPIPAGSFQMGDPWSEGYSNERPVHTVTLSAYAIGKYEVTNQEVCAVYNWANGQGYFTTLNGNTAQAYGQELLDLDEDWPGYQTCQIEYAGGQFVVKSRDGYSMGEHPVVEISWYGAAAYCNWLSAMEGLTPCYNTSDWSWDFSNNGYHLPTEAQWERAAAWSTAGGGYHWRYGNGSDSISCATANYYNGSAFCNPLGLSSRPYTSPVGYYAGASSPAGCFDMSGNVWEWCNDWWYRVYTTSPVTNPEGPASGSYRLLRGGSWYNNDYDCRAAYRNDSRPDYADLSLGFRVARTP